MLDDTCALALQIVPEYVSVERCSGTCHQGNKYHNCIPTQTNVVKKQVNLVALLRVDATIDETNCVRNKVRTS